MAEGDKSKRRSHDPTMAPPPATPTMGGGKRSVGGAPVGMDVSPASSPGVPFDPADELPAGKRLGKYQVVRLLGRGGMGAVYEALDVVLQRKVALKILPRQYAESEDALKRFLREAQLAARLNHPNAVGIYDIARKGTVYFLALELVVGASGQDLLEARGPMDWREATRAIADATRALVAAHGAGLIHRDIKPANLLWAQSGTVKLADFGLAKPTVGKASHVSLTQNDVFVGTPLFMSPEQCRNDGVDGRSDIYSLAATYYTLMAGSAPYTQGSAIQILFAHCSAPVPDVRATLPDVPPLCAHIIQKAMAKDPADRYQSADEMLADLESLLGGSTDAPGDLGMLEGALAMEHAQPVPALKPPASAHSASQRRLWIAAAVAGVVLLVGGTLIAIIAGSSGGTKPEVAEAVDVPQPVVAPRPQPKVIPADPAPKPTVFDSAKPADPPAPRAVVPPSPALAPASPTPQPVAPAETQAPSPSTPAPAVASVPSAGEQTGAAASPAVSDPPPPTAVVAPPPPPAAAPTPSASEPAAQQPAQTEPTPPSPPEAEDDPIAARDPALREYAEAKRWAVRAQQKRSKADLKRAGVALMLWHDFFARSGRPHHARWVDEAKTLAERYDPGVSSAGVARPPRDPEGPPLPPPAPGMPGEPPDQAGDGRDRAERNNDPPPRPDRRTPRQRDRDNR